MWRACRRPGLAAIHKARRHVLKTKHLRTFCRLVPLAFSRSPGFISSPYFTTGAKLNTRRRGWAACGPRRYTPRLDEARSRGDLTTNSFAAINEAVDEEQG
jgi:hypothetical protein